MKRKKQLFFIFIFMFCLSLTTGCGQQKEEVSLSIWASEDEYSLVEEAVQEFTKEHEKEADFNIRINKEDIDDVLQTLQTNPDTAADIFNFASDQFLTLYKADLLLPITAETDQIISDCGGTNSLIIKGITADGELYAYPATASNGYFMFYNSDYYTDDDVKSLDRMLEIAEENGKYVAMDWSSGWYLYSFFGGAGKTIHTDESGEHNVCDFNSTSGKYSGVDITEAMLRIAQHPGFKNISSDVIVDEVRNGDVIAVVNGTWNANTFGEIWGEHCEASKLPTYTIKDEQVQMSSFAGFKYIGINSHTKQAEWAMKLSRWLTNYDNQIKHFNKIGECPANTKAASSDDVQASSAIAALNDQLQYAGIQNICDPYWNAMTVFGTYIAAGNPDNKDLQTLLDETTAKITE